MSRIDPAQAEAWSLIATRIKDAAFADGISDIKQLEAIFRVGEVWRKWIKRKRIARDVNRTRIINEAQQRGWLDLASIPFKDIAALPDEIIQALDQGYPEPLKSLPKPPPGGAHQTAPLIVNALLDDAVNGIASKRQQEFPEVSNNADFDRWTDAVSAIREAFALINPGRELTLGADADLLRVRLIAAYRRDGYK
jgi:hypothetical protein